MNNHFLYIDSKCVGLALHWLESKSDVTKVTFVCPEPFLDECTVIAQQYPRRITPEPLVIWGRHWSKSPLYKARELTEVKEVVLPLAVEHTAMRHISGVTIPQIGPYYSVFKRLRQCGFTLFRLYGLGGQRVIEIPHFLDSFMNLHSGRRCFIVGNGPSLNKVDMTLLSDEITFGANRCYLGFEKWGFQFTYWGCIDRIQIEDYASEYVQKISHDIPSFIPFEYLPYFSPGKICPINQSYKVLDSPMFSENPDEIFMGNTITYSLIQIAALMGCNPIILIGNDHSYNLKDISPEEQLKDLTPSEIKRVTNKRFWITVLERFFSRSKSSSGGNNKIQLWSETNKSRATHFDREYTQGKHFAMPRPRLAENAFRSAQHYADKTGIQILNATSGTQLKELPIVDFNDLF